MTVSEKYPQVTQIYAKVAYSHEWQTKGCITGFKDKAQVTPSGVKFLNLFTENF